MGVFGVSKNSNSISNLSQNVMLNVRAIYQWIDGINIIHKYRTWYAENIIIWTFAIINISSISTKRRPGHWRFPTPKGTTKFAPTSVPLVFAFELSTNHLSGLNSSGCVKFCGSWQDIIFWHRTTVCENKI